MSNYWWGIVVVVLVVGVQGSDGPQNPGDDAKKLQGTWVVVSAEVNGEKKSADEIKSVTMLFKGDEFTLAKTGHEEKGRFKLDPTQKPKEMDWLKTDSKEDTALCIYELDGDTLKLCWRKPGAKRPTEFTGKDTDGLMILHRK